MTVESIRVDSLPFSDYTESFELGAIFIKYRIKTNIQLIYTILTAFPFLFSLTKKKSRQCNKQRKRVEDLKRCIILVHKEALFTNLEGSEWPL